MRIKQLDDKPQFIHTKELRTMERKHRQAKLSSKKKSTVPRKTLTKTDIDYLQKQTSFTELDILEWFSRFMEECPQGILTREKVSFELLLSAFNIFLILDDPGVRGHDDRFS